VTTTIVTTCKGRGKQLALALTSWLEETPCPIVVALDGCPDVHAFDNRARVVRTTAAESDLFSKPRALNTGARAVDTDNILFLDSDTVLRPGFWDWYRRRVTPDALFVVPPRSVHRDLTGVLGVATREFWAVHGADEGFVGWGAEDLDLRLRLHLKRSLRVVDIPIEFVFAIPHDDDLRTQFYSEKDKMASHTKNIQRLVDNAEAISGQSIWQLLELPEVKRLFLLTERP